MRATPHRHPRVTTAMKQGQTLRLASAQRQLLMQLAGGLFLATLCHGQTPYDFGNPSAEEQLHIESINRARHAPVAEGVLLAATTDPDVTGACAYFGVNLAQMQIEFNALTTQPPLAPNAKLTATARGHSAWMLANAVQAHDETNPSNTFASRLTAAGYPYATAAENIAAATQSGWHGHAGLEIDWGYGSYGMQNPRGHRDNIHNPDYREIGVGVSLGTNTGPAGSVGPLVVTQDFGTRFASPILGTGVAYYDINANNFYDVGEGIAGLTVNVSNTSAFCVTASGGGWTVPVADATATRTVTFSGLNLNQPVSLAVTAGRNAKADLKLPYTPPPITSATSADAGASHILTFNPVGGATGYVWNYWTPVAAATEDCENADHITATTTGSYAVINTNVKQQGTAAFHLVNSTAANQCIELNTIYDAQADASFSFQSCMRYTTASDKLRVQIQQEGATDWQNVFTQDGGGAYETQFTRRSAALTTMAGKGFRIRFLLRFGYGEGTYYADSGDSFGWFIDSITFTRVTARQNPVRQSLTGTSGSFTPAVGTYLMSVAPVISSLDFPPSYQTLTISAPATTASFATWAAHLEATNGLPAGTLANQPDADRDHDGRANLIEYAFGSSPLLSGDPSPRLPFAFTTATHFVLQYQCDTSLTDITITAQASTTPGNWKPLGDPDAPSGFSDTVIATSGTLQTHQSTIPRPPGGISFMRVKVSIP